MKLIRYGKIGEEKTGIHIEGKNYSLASYVPGYNEAFFAQDGIAFIEKIVKQNKNSLQEIDSTERIGCPIARPSKIVCVGLNYAAHAKETNAPVPAEPVLFLKSTTAICGPYDEVIIPRDSVKTDWEVELAVVIGQKASYVSEADAHKYIAGYMLHNDISERAFQLERGGTWDKGKGCDTFAPIGPWLVTPDEIGDPHNLNLWLSVNGTKVQNSNTNDFIFQIPFLISYISQYMTLLPGDIISTGTPQGVGLGMNPPLYLKKGDEMELGIDGLGVAKQTCVEWQHPNT